MKTTPDGPDTQTIRPFLEEHHLALAREIAEFTQREIRPLPAPATDDDARIQARGLVATLAPWVRFAIPKPDLRACVMIREALAGASPLADAVFALQCLGSMPLVLADPQNPRLADVLAGRKMAAFAMTEPEAGSDVASMKTTAQGDLLTGRKTLISNAGIADFYTVFASVDPSKGNKGIAAFVVDADTPGLRFVRPLVLSAPHPLGEIEFENCRGARLPGDGFKLGLETLDRLRATVAAAACGMARRALDEAIAHAKSRRQFGRPLSEFQIVQQKLATMATDLAAARLLVYRAAWEKDRGAERVTLPSAMAKVFATEAAQRIVDQSLQILGGAGALADHPVERLYRAVRSLRIYEGTTEVLQVVIAGQLLK